MTSNPMRKPVLALALLVLPLALAAPVLAARPTREVTIVVDRTTVNTVLCPGIAITFVEGGSFKETTFYDGAGNPVKSILTNFNQRYTETATANGKTLRTNYPTVFITSLPGGASVQVGLRATYSVPGAGLVLLDAGRVGFDASGDVVFEAGQHQLLDGDLAAFCAYFAA